MEDHEGRRVHGAGTLLSYYHLGPVLEMVEEEEDRAETGDCRAEASIDDRDGVVDFQKHRNVGWIGMTTLVTGRVD